MARVRRLTRQKRAGHAGTLDPAATGVLPIALGRATRLIEYLADARKTYQARVHLGVTTTTLDATGEVVDRRPADRIDRATVEAALPRFRGAIDQVPPMYSALKVGGQRLYDLARRGETIDRAPRRIEIYRLELTGYQAPILDLEVECSKGTYIRTLADDLGRAIGCGAHLAGLIRTRVGPFALADAVSLDRLAEVAATGDWPGVLRAADEILIGWPAVIVDPAGARAIVQGRALPAGEPAGEADRARAYSTDGEFLAVLERDPVRGIWRPVKVLADPGPPGAP